MPIARGLVGAAAQVGTVGAVADTGVGAAGIGTAVAVDPASAGPALGLVGRVEAMAGEEVGPAAVTAVAVDPAAVVAAMGVAMAAGAADPAE